MFKKKNVLEVKQPQELYCSNLYCTNEIADLSPLSYILTDFAVDNYALFYCLDCIIEERFS